MAIAVETSAATNFTAASGTVTISTSNTNDIIVVDVETNTSAVTSVTSAHLTFTLHAVAVIAQSGSNYILARYIAIAAAPLSSEVITVQPNAAVFTTVVATAISGGNVTTPFDVGPWALGATGGGGTHPAADPISITTLGATTLVLASFRVEAQSPTNGSGFTQVYGANYMLTEYQTLSSAQTLSCTIGTGVGEANGAIVDAFIPAGATPGISGAFSIDSVSGLGDDMSGASGVQTTEIVGLNTSQANDVLLLFIDVFDTTVGVTSITDNSGVTSTWTQLCDASSYPGFRFQLWWSVASAAIAGAKLTAVFSASGAATFEGGTLKLVAIAGAKTSNPPFDPLSGGTGTGYVTEEASPSDPLSVTTTYANTLLFGTFDMNSTGNPTAGSGFTQLAAIANDGNLLEFKKLSSSGTQSITITTGSGDSGAAIGVAVEQASGALAPFLTIQANITVDLV